ncbi:penicillin acylase family protein [Agrobacterium rhizogenes]|nr:penicillin acylase family protein [Rhizobium rhizogenes]
MKLFRRGLGIAVIAAVAVFVSAYLILWSGLPLLDGKVVGEVGEGVSVLRDENGVPTIRAKTRADGAFALGFLMGQERYFQMDLLRRSAAGELSELVGPAAAKSDEQTKIHEFRKRAKIALSRMSSSEREILRSFVSGVNTGREDLALAPFEYWVLWKHPQAWQEEDSLLCIYALYLDLQESNGWSERRYQTALDKLGQPLADFFYPEMTSWEAPVDGSFTFHAFHIPEFRSFLLSKVTSAAQFPLEAREFGSNNYAVDGFLTSDGRAIVGGDMHLALGVPNIWYRARLELQGDHLKSLTGIFLPGFPVLVSGSNGSIAWTLTNSRVDTSDVVILDQSGMRDDQYRTPDGARSLDVEETTCFGDQSCHPIKLENSIFGPVIGRDSKGRRLAYRWLAYDEAAVGLRGLLELETANTVDEAIAFVHTAQIPTQNFVVADREGHIGWTLAGPLPMRTGCDGKLPSSSADRRCSWELDRSRQKIPQVLDPVDHRLWTANNRVVGPPALEQLGVRDYGLAIRAYEIRKNLFAKSRFDENDLFSISLDTKAVMFDRWQKVLVAELSARPNLRRRDVLLDTVVNWDGSASADSVAYRLIRDFRDQIIRFAYEPVMANMRYKGDGRIKNQSYVPPEAEEVAWSLFQARPDDFCAQRGCWYDAISNALSSINSQIDKTAGGRVEAYSWGARNHIEIHSMLSRVLPLASYLLDPRNVPASGDLYVPRVLTPGFGASERMVVSPGHESDGFFQMPASQSSNPLSPYYLNGHSDWIDGKKSPFLPGVAKWELKILPRL